MRFIFFLVFVIGAVSAASIAQPKIEASASASAAVTGGEGTVTRTVGATRDGSATSASASASVSATSSVSQTVTPCETVAPCQTVVPCETVAPCAQASAQVDYSQVSFQRMTKEQMEEYQRANPGCQLVIRKVNPSPCVVRAPCATLVKRLSPCSPPPIVYNPCVRVPTPCQTKTVRRRLRASSSSSASVSKTVDPCVTVTRTDPAPCAPTTVVHKIEPTKMSASASASASVDQTATPVVAC